MAGSTVSYWYDSVFEDGRIKPVTRATVINNTSYSQQIRGLYDLHDIGNLELEKGDLVPEPLATLVAVRWVMRPSPARGGDRGRERTRPLSPLSPGVRRRGTTKIGVIRIDVVENR